MGETMQKRTMKRLKGFDYRRPFFYMVTLKRLKGLRPFCGICRGNPPPKDAQGRARYLVANDLTEAFASVIRAFHTHWRGLWPIETFIVMPDHLHLLIRIRDMGDQLALGKYVYQLMKALSAAYWETVGGMADGTAIDKTLIVGSRASNQRVVLPAPSGNIQPAPSDNAPAPVFARDWHDWIVKRDGQLAAFTRYIRENPQRAWLRQQNRRYFGQVTKTRFLGRDWFAYGNLAILDLPVLKAIKGHRTTKPDSPEWKALIDECMRIGPGGAGVGTFMSPLEKACGNALATSGGKWVVLSPEGFHERWHPGRQYERFCAEGRMLFLSLYPVLNRTPTKKELYQRCHEMGDLAVAGLSESKEQGASHQLRRTENE